MAKESVWGLEAIRRAWQSRENDRVRAATKVAPDSPTREDAYASERWVEDVFPTYVLVRNGMEDTFFKIPYEVDADNNLVFGEPTQVMRTYVPAKDVSAVDKVKVSLSDSAEYDLSLRGRYVRLTAVEEATQEEQQSEDEGEQVPEQTEEEKQAAEVSEVVNHLLGLR